MNDVQLARPWVLICAVDARWEAAWRRSEPAAAIVKLATVADCHARWDASPASVMVIEFFALAPSDVLDLLATRRRERKHGLAILVGGAALDAHRWELMECAADLVISSERQLPEACHIARRHLRRWNPPELSLRERAWAKLPWQS